MLEMTQAHQFTASRSARHKLARLTRAPVTAMLNAPQRAAAQHITAISAILKAGSGAR